MILFELQSAYLIEYPDSLKCNPSLSQFEDEREKGIGNSIYMALKYKK